MKSLGLLVLVALCFGQSASIMGAPARANILTYHNDNFRTGLNTNEAILSPANVNSNAFGKLFTYNVDGYVHAQPLYVSGVVVLGQGIHNLLYVATEHNSLYALEADSKRWFHQWSAMASEFGAGGNYSYERVWQPI